MKHSTNQLVVLRRDKSLSPTLSVEVEPSELYRIRVFPSRYRPVGRFQRAAAEGTRTVELLCPIHPDRVTAVDFPDYASLPDDLKRVLGASHVEGFEGAQGQALYDALDQGQRAGLLNLQEKMESTRLLNGRSCWNYVIGLYRVRGDRVFVDVTNEFRDAVKNAEVAGLFEAADDSLHTPPPGYSRAGSFKTFDPFGNLQLSFFASDAAPLRFKVDADIDDARGIGHFFQVLRNFLSGEATHPYDIHEILVATQQLNPGYVLRA